MKLSNALLGGLGIATLAIGALSGPAAADDKFAYTWTVTGASDYIFRGLSYTQNDPTVNSYLEFTYNTGGILGTAYLGFWTSNINTADNGLGPWEQDVYLGIRPVTGPINWDIAALWYIYGNKGEDPGGYFGFGPGTGSVWDTDYVEFKVGATTSPITNLTLGATLYYQVNQDVAAPENVSIEGTVAYTFPAVGIFTPTVSALIGHSSAEDNAFYFDTPNDQSGYWQGAQEYYYWNAGLKLAVEKFTFDFRYWDTDIPSEAFGANFADERFVFTTSLTLP
ncbi:MAG: TorF family putative porin [Hyphomicrobium sp.]|jgi:uncharacterized protein (TIGR02001 family)